MKIKIDFDNLDDESYKNLYFLLNSQSEKNAYIWNEGNHEVDGNTYIINRKIYQRERKEGKEKDRRFEIYGNNPLGSGGFAYVDEIQFTLALNHKEKKAYRTTREKRAIKTDIFPILGVNQRATLENECKLINQSETKDFSAKTPSLNRMVMDKVSGESLDKILKRDLDRSKPLTTKQRVALTKALLHALKAQITDKNILHRDIKPSNIMVDLADPEQPKVVFIDFGLSNDVNNIRYECCGTDGYIPDEVKKAHLRLIGPKSDVYSLGCVISQVWRASNDWLDYFDKSQIEKELFTGITGLTDEERESILEMVLKMLEKHPNDRYSIEQAIKKFPPFNHNNFETNKSEKEFFGPLDPEYWIKELESFKNQEEFRELIDLSFQYHEKKDDGDEIRIKIGELLFKFYENNELSIDWDEEDQKYFEELAKNDKKLAKTVWLRQDFFICISDGIFEENLVIRLQELSEKLEEKKDWEKWIIKSDIEQINMQKEEPKPLNKQNIQELKSQKESEVKKSEQINKGPNPKEINNLRKQKAEKFLADFLKAIDTIGEFHEPVKEEAKKLHQELKDLLDSTFKEDSIVQLNEYKVKVKISINNSRPVLEKDLAFWDIVENLAKELYNVPASFFGYSLFELKKPVAIEEIEKLEKDLNLEEEETIKTTTINN